MKYYITIFIWIVLALFVSTFSFNYISSANTIENLIGTTVMFLFGAGTYYYISYILKK